LEMFERQAVPTKGAQARILQAEAVLQTLDTGAMEVPQRVALTGIYGLLMVVPVVAIVGYWAFAGERLRVDASVALSGDPEAVVYERARRQALAKAANMDVAQFIADLKERDVETFPTGLSEESIAAVEARLGGRFPDDIRALYRVSNGMMSLGLAPLEQATRPDPSLLARLTANAREGEIQLIRSGTHLGDHVYYASAALLSNTVRLGPEEASTGSATLVDLNHPQLVEGHSLIRASVSGDSVFLHTVDLRGSLQETWVVHRAQDVMDQRYAQQAAVLAESLRGEDVAHLLEHYPQPGFLVRTFFHVRAPR